MRRHPQCLQSSKETAINNSINAKESPKDLPTKRRKRRRLKHTQRLLFIIIVWKLCLIINLIRYPVQHLFNVYRRRDRDCIAIGLRPAIFHAGRVAFAWAKRGKERVVGEHGPDGRRVVVEINGVYGDPACTTFTWRQCYLRMSKK